MILEENNLFNMYFEIHKLKKYILEEDDLKLQQYTSIEITQNEMLNGLL